MDIKEDMNTHAGEGSFKCETRFSVSLKRFSISVDPPVQSDNSFVVARLQIGAKEEVNNQSSSSIFKRQMSRLDVGVILNNFLNYSLVSEPPKICIAFFDAFYQSLHTLFDSAYVQRTLACITGHLVQSRLPPDEIVNQTAREKISLNALRTRLRSDSDLG